jgi:hypothetical protein
MRLSPFHKQLAKMIAQGLPNRDILTQVKISPSRLSVLKRNPLMIREIARQSEIEESKYRKALDVFGAQAERVARKLVKMVTEDISVDSKVKSELGLRILTTLGQAEGVTVDGGAPTRGQSEESFEVMLRSTHRFAGGGGGGELAEEQLHQAFIELEEENDLREAEEQPQHQLTLRQVGQVWQTQSDADDLDADLDLDDSGDSDSGVIDSGGEDDGGSPSVQPPFPISDDLSQLLGA